MDAHGRRRQCQPAHREEQQAFNCMDDAGSPDVSYGGPVSFGSSARLVLVPTLGDRLRMQRPGARVVALSLKARAAIPLAGHGGVVTWFDEPGRTFVTSRAFSPTPVESVRAFIAREPPKADHGKVWTLQAREETYLHTRTLASANVPRPDGHRCFRSAR